MNGSIHKDFMINHRDRSFKLHNINLTILYLSAPGNQMALS